MTTYQGRLKSKPQFQSYLLLLVIIVAIFAISVLGVTNRVLRDELDTRRVGLLTCQEFLADLEELEAF